MKNFPLLALIVIMFIYSCKYENVNQNIYNTIHKKAFLCCDTARRLIHSGDIIARSGNDFTSSLLMQMNLRDPTYSHVGVAYIDKDIIYVYHIVGGELSNNDTIRCDRLSQYVNGYNNKGFGIFRFDVKTNVVSEILNEVKLLRKKKILFDLDFDLSTDDKMYCTELVAKCMEKSMHKKDYFTKNTISGKTYIAPDNIFLHKDCHEIKRLRYF